MIFLEHKDCILMSHADRTGRLWSRPLAEFLQRVDLGRPSYYFYYYYYCYYYYFYYFYYYDYYYYCYYY